MNNNDNGKTLIIPKIEVNYINEQGYIRTKAYIQTQIIGEKNNVNLLRISTRI